MSEFNKKEENKGGFLASLSRVFGGGASASGGASGIGGGAGSAGGFGGLFATKAGVLGMVLGGATIAAGVGVVYNFIGPSSKPVYSPQLFQDTYYEEQANNAGVERAKARAEAAAPASTLEMFREQARKDGLGMGGEGSSGAESGSLAEPSAGDAAGGTAGSGAYGGADTAAGAPSGFGARLQSSAGFGGGKGAAGAGANTMKISGGSMPGGPGGMLSSVYRPPAGQAPGGSSGMKKSLAAAVRNSPKYTVPNFNKKGVFGQAKFAGKVGNQAAYSATGAGARSTASEAFAGETAGGGDVVVPGGGVGIGGSGISAGANLKTSDPSLNKNDSQPPRVGEPENVSPWKKTTDMAMYGMLAAAVLIFIANLLAKIKTPQMLLAAKIVAMLAMAAAAVVVISGMKLMSSFGQKWAGGMYAAAGALLMFKAWQALGAANAASATEIKDGVVDKVVADTPNPQTDTIGGDKAGLLEDLKGVQPPLEPKAPPANDDLTSV